MTAYKAAIASRPSMAVAHLNLALYQASQGRHQESLKVPTPVDPVAMKHKGCYIIMRYKRASNTKEALPELLRKHFDKLGETSVLARRLCDTKRS